MEGDEIYILGFSRGAYTARALPVSLPQFAASPGKSTFHRLEDIWNFYRLSPRERYSDEARRKYEIDQMVLEVPRSRAAGQMPGGLGHGRVLRYSRRLGAVGSGAQAHLLDARISRQHAAPAHRGVALQALAIDEQRPAFSPTTWVGDPTDVNENQHVEQVWFCRCARQRRRRLHCAQRPFRSGPDLDHGKGGEL